MAFFTGTENEGTVALLGVDKTALAAAREGVEAHVGRFLDEQSFNGAYGKTASIYDSEGNLRQVWVGRSKETEDPRSTLQLFAKLAQSLPAHSYALAEGWSDIDPEQAALGWGLGTYQFSRYIKKPDRKFGQLVLPSTVDQAATANCLKAIFLARDLINTPAGDLGPAELCAQATEIAAANGATIAITKGPALEHGFPAIHAVGKGSDRPPALIDLRWGHAGQPMVTLVGKGVVFDSGGLNIKQASGMLWMKKDMGGAAVTLALASLIMAQKLPIRLRLLIPAVENAVGARAYHPGDVVRTKKGLTVEIGNTDAEGRMILSDALTEAASEKPDLIIDMATLTGACRVALGQDIPGFWTPSDEIADALMTASRQVADPLWRLPLWMPYLKNMKSPIADLNNISSDGFGGAICAALFLQEFVKPFSNWIHLDIYGWRLDEVPGTPKGGEANALRALFQFLKQRYPA